MAKNKIQTQTLVVIPQNKKQLVQVNKFHHRERVICLFFVIFDLFHLHPHYTRKRRWRYLFLDESSLA